MERFAKPWNKLRAMRVPRRPVDGGEHRVVVDDRTRAAGVLAPDPAGPPGGGVTVREQRSRMVGHQQAGSQTILLVHQRGPLAWDRSDPISPSTARYRLPCAARTPRSPVDESGARSPTPSWPTVTSSPTRWRTCLRPCVGSIATGRRRERAQHRKDHAGWHGAIIIGPSIPRCRSGSRCTMFVRGNERSSQANLSLAQRPTAEAPPRWTATRCARRCRRSPSHRCF